MKKADIKHFFRILPVVKLKATLSTMRLIMQTRLLITAEVMEDEMDLPAISDESDLDLLEGDIVRNIQVNIRMYDGWDE